MGLPMPARKYGSQFSIWTIEEKIEETKKGTKMAACSEAKEVDLGSG